MPTLVLDPPPPELRELLERRRRSAKRHVDEVLILDPEKRAGDWLAFAGGEYRPVERSGLIELGSAAPAERIDWP